MRRDGLVLALLATIGLLFVAVYCDPLASRRAKYAAKSVQSEAPPAESTVEVDKPKPKAKPEEKKGPKCELLADNCLATTDTHLAVGSNGMSFQPPEGWAYAKHGDFSVAMDGEQDVVMGFTETDGPAPDKVIAAITPLLDELKITEVKVAVLKPRLSKPQSTIEAGGTPVHLWEVDKGAGQPGEPKMNGEAGKLLVVVAKFDTQTVVGVSFMLKKADSSQGAAVGDSIKTLARSNK
jgi:hypothetical protein